MSLVYVDPFDLARIRDPFDYSRLIRRIEDRRWRVERALNRFYYELPIIVRRKNIDGITERVRLVYYSWRDLLAYPKFTKRLFDASVTSGRNLQLEVRVDNGVSSLKPTVKWFKNSKEIVETDNIKLTHYHPDSYVLSIYGAIPGDRGLYTCRATNAAGTTTTMALVDVEPCKTPYLPLRTTFYDTLYALE